MKALLFASAILFYATSVSSQPAPSGLPATPTAIASVDTVDLGVLQAFVAVAMVTTVHNYSGDSIEIHLGTGNNLDGVSLGLRDDPLPWVIAPQSSKEVFVTSMGVPFSMSTQGRLIYLDVFKRGYLSERIDSLILKMKWTDAEEDITDVTREFSLKPSAIMAVPYGGSITLFPGFPSARFGETILLRNHEALGIRITDLQMDRSAIGQVTTLQDLPFIVPSGDTTSVRMDPQNLMAAYGYLLVYTDGRVGPGDGLASLPIKPESQSVSEESQEEQFNLVVSQGRTIVNAPHTLMNAQFTVLDLKGAVLHRSANNLRWEAPSRGQSYIVMLTGSHQSHVVTWFRKVIVP